MLREILKLTRNQLECLVCTNSYSLDSNLEWDGEEEHYDILFENIQDVITNSAVGSVHCKRIVKRLSDNKYFEITYYEGTEDSCSCFNDHNCDEISEFREVFPKTITSIIYE